MNIHRSQIASVAIAAFLSSAAAVAHEGRHEAGGHGGPHKTDGPRMEPAFFQQLYPAEVVMRHADAIGLTDDQKAAIQSAMPKPGKGADRERQGLEARKLEQLLRQDPVDEPQALAQLDKLLDVEDNFKRRQLQALIKIKNILTLEQRHQLDELRQRHTGGSPKGEEPRSSPREAGPATGGVPR